MFPKLSNSIVVSSAFVVIDNMLFKVNSIGVRCINLMKGINNWRE